jgi:hypothetical protein
MRTVISANSRRAFALAIAVVLSGAGAAIAQGPDVVARDAWAREPAPSRDVTAMFVVLDNHGPTPRAVVSASCDAAEKAELHEMKMTNGMMSMSPVKQIEIPAGGTADLKPGGLHVMLFGLKRRPAPGDTLSVILTLDDGTKVPVTAAVRKQEMQ